MDDYKEVTFDFTQFLPQTEELMRDRLSGLEEDDNRAFAFLRVIRITISEAEAREEFRNKLEKLRLRALFDPTPKIDNHSKLFATSVLDEFNKWLSTLDYEIAFQLEALLDRRIFCPDEFLDLKDDVDAVVTVYGVRAISSCIRSLGRSSEDHENRPSPKSVRELFAEACGAIRNGDWKEPSYRKGLFECHRATVTPTSIVLKGPFPDESNRVIRQYAGHHSNFLRVEFREEDRLNFRRDREVDGDAFLDERIGTILKQGIQIAGRRFEFLGYSSSALREHIVWFMTPFVYTRDGETDFITADFIRKSLGDFSKVANCPARYGARLSQAFSATEPTVTIKTGEVIRIDDIKSSTGSCHTDGVGTISPDLAREIWKGGSPAPSVFQIRFGGAKGVVCVDDRLEGRVVALRESMEKFSAPEHNTIEVARTFDRPSPMYFNRPLIMVLETLKVPLEPFMQLQQDAVKKTEDASQSLSKASELLDQHGLGTAYRLRALSLRLQELGLEFPREGDGDDLLSFLQRVLKFAVNNILRDLKYHARIPVPNAWTLVGVADEWDYLEEGEIYGKPA
jgi:hypothetical protein